MNFERYQRQLALSEISHAQQNMLGQSHIVMVGAGGLGTVVLPYLSAAGVGEITIIDHDSVDLSNLHRQTIYKSADVGRNKAEMAAEYCRALNPDIQIYAHAKRVQDIDVKEFENATLIIDGSDNFETKVFMNALSIEMQIPLLSASVHQWQGQIMLLAGYAKDRPCYHCLFPKLPTHARNCNEAGILGTSAGLIGMIQAHTALCFVLGLENVDAGMLITFDLQSLRTQTLNIPKDLTCTHCKDGQKQLPPTPHTGEKDGGYNFDERIGKTRLRDN